MELFLTHSLLKQIKWILVFIIVFSSLAAESICQQGQLPNGLTYYLHHDPASKKHISLDFIIKVGSLDEQEHERGFSHLIEHLATNEMKFDGIKIENDLCPLWGRYELTSYEFTQYHMDIPLGISNGLEKGLKSFLSIFNSFPITHQNLADAQEEVLEEISEDNQSSLSQREQIRIAYEYPHFKGKHPIGYPNCISNATVEQVRDFFKKHYQPSQLAIIVIGNINLESAQQFIEKYFGSIIPSSFEEPNAQKIHLPPQDNLFYFDQEFCFTKLLPRMSSHDFFLFSIWTHLFKEHLSSAGFTPQLETLTYPHLFRLKVFLKEGQNDLLLLHNAWESFLKTPISPERFNDLKAQIKSAMLVQMEDPRFLSDHYRDLFVSQILHMHASQVLDEITREDFYESLKPRNNYDN